MVWGLYCMTIGKRFVASWNKKGIIFCAVFYAVPLTVFGSLGNFYSQVNVEAHIINLLSLSSESVDRIFSFVLGIWMLGILVGQGFFLYSTCLARKMKTVGTEILDGPWFDILQEAKEELDVKREVRLYRFDAAASPCNVGFFRPTIIINCSCIDIQSMRAIIYHELVHIQKHDNMKVFLMRELMYLHWFNPFAHLLRHLFELWMELTVDEEVLTEYSDIISKKDYFLAMVYLLDLYKERMKEKECRKYAKYVSFINGARVLSWRIDWMKKFRTKTVGKKILMGVCGMAFLAMGTFSSVKASAALLDLYEDVAGSSVEAYDLTGKMEDFGYCSEEFYTDNPLEGNVVLMDDAMLARGSYSYIWTIPSDTMFRSTQGYYKLAGGEIRLTVDATPTTNLVKVGIIQPDGSGRYVEGYGLFAHTFSIQQMGTHYIYAQNKGTGDVEVAILVQY